MCEETSGQDIRESLALAFERTLPRTADIVRDPATRLAHYPLPVLNRHMIHLVSRVSVLPTVSLYAGFAIGGEALALTGWPEHFIELGKADGVSIDTAGDAVAYGTAFLETTRTMDEIFYLVAGVDDIHFLPEPSPEEESRTAAAIAGLAGAIVPAGAITAGDHFVVTIYAIRENTLERHDLAVTRDGDIDDRITAIETGLPVVYSIGRGI